MQLKKLLPSFLTCLNLMCGCVAVVLAFNNNLVWAAYLVFLAAFFDLLDGMAARLLHAYSEFGKQLDSLADMVSFGLVPGVVMFKIFQYPFNELLEGGGILPVLLTFYPFLITVFSALRLAKFNIDVRQTDSFIGLNTPANTMFTVSWPLIIHSGPAAFSAFILNPYVLIVLIALQSYLLIAEIPMFSFKMKSLAWKGNEIRYLFLGLVVILLVTFLFAAIPLIIFFYVLLSFLLNKLKTT
jgi:CDP-diacylglycerol---serine O-phosphatidyltransferase